MVKNYITGEEFNPHSNIDVKKFYEFIKQNNITIEQYAEKYFKNVSHIKHNRPLLPR